MYRLLVNLCIVGLLVRSNSVGASPVDGESLIGTSDLFLFDMPAPCEDKNFCFVKNYGYAKYPERKIEEILDQLPLLPFNEETETGFSFRNGSAINNECEAENQFSNKPIYYIRDENDEVRAVLQSPGRFEQIYSARWCKRPGRISYDTAHLVKGRTLEKYNIACVETYMNFDFLVLTVDGRVEIASPKGGIPVCCKCRYTIPN